MKVKAKFSLSFGMWILAWIMAIVGGFSYDRKFILFAMTASFIGDLFLMWYGIGGKYRKSKYFIWGMLSFAIAHIFYAKAFGSRFPKLNLDAIFGFVTGILIFFYVLMRFFFIVKEKLLYSKSKQNTKILLFVILYLVIFLIDFTTIFGYLVYDFGVRSCFTAFGIASFLLSDCWIGYRELCKDRSQKIQRQIWFLYVLGQTLLIIS